MKKLIAAMAIVPMVALYLSVAAGEQPAWAGSGGAYDPQCELSVNYENDQFLDTDQNYSTGLLFTHTCVPGMGGSLGSAHSWSPLRKWNEPLFGLLFAAPYWKYRASSLHFGLSLYTPNELKEPTSKSDGRPYASLLLFGDSILRATETAAVKQGMQFGILGLPIGGDIQKAVHEILSYDDPQGWETEISRGGEPVFWYGIQKQWLLCPLSNTDVCDRDQDAPDFDLAWDVGGSVGSYTSLRTGISGRLGLGRLISKFWGHYGPIHGGNSNFHLPFIHLGLIPSSDGGKANGIDNGKRNHENTYKAKDGNQDEAFFFLRGGLDYVLYSAVLQGQFRENKYEVAASDVERAVPYASVGLAFRYGELRLSVSHTLRGPEISGGKSHRWTSFSVGHLF